jgi:hypothetical protein
MPTCGKCRTVKMMLDKENMRYDERVDIIPIHEDYPIIYWKGIKMNYRDFLKEMKEMKKK